MVIPTYARRIGITVRLMYVSATVVFASLGLSLLLSNHASALLPISSLPIVGQPVADVANATLDNVVEPTVGIVTGILPKPVGNAVQAPVTAITEAAKPLIGPSSSENPTQQIVSTILPPANTPAVAPTPSVPPVAAKIAPEAKTAQQAARQPWDSSSEEKLPLSTGLAVAFLDSFLSPLQGVVKGLSASHPDISVTIATIVTLLLMVLILARLLAMNIKYNTSDLIQADGSAVMRRRDLAQASALTLALLVTGVLVVVALCFN